MYLRIIFAICLCIAVAAAQYDSPAPPRPIIPGAVPVQGGAVSRPAVRRRPIGGGGGGSPQGGGAQPLRRVIGGRGAGGVGGRRLPSPLLEQSIQARPAPRPLFQDTPIPVVRAPQPPSQSPSVAPRPVVEDLEDEDNLVPQASPSPVLQASPSPSPIPSVEQQQSIRNIDDYPVPTRQQYRPQPSQDEEPQYNRQLRPQPQQRQERPQQKPYAQQQYNRQQQVARPIQRQPQPIAHSKDTSVGDAAAPHQHSTRSRKPVVQVIRKFRDDNPDGSITWGFENDDGTYKEETIGTDCVTRGKYGYFDPDGVKREFTYSSGIPCDPATRGQDSETQETNEGYIDYSNNRYVYPNGESIGLDSMVKNRARKQTAYRN